MDLLSWYSCYFVKMARPDVVGVENLFQATPSKQPPETPEKRFRAIQRSDLYLWTFLSLYSSRVGGIARPDVVGVEY